MRDSLVRSDEDEEICDWSQLPDEPLLSVLMVTYNHRKYITEAIDSILAQKVDFLYEICIGEDESNDGTREICQEYAKKYPEKIRLFLRNRKRREREQYKVPFMYNGYETYRSCRGKYLALLEGDDYWICNQKLQRQVETMEANPGISVCSHYTIGVPENQPWRVHSYPYYYLREFDLRYLLEKCYFLATCSLVYRRIDISGRPEFIHAYAGDTLHTAIQLEHGTGIVLPESMAVYRMHSKGASAGAAGYDPMSANREQWRLFHRMYSASHRSAVDKGYAYILYRSVIVNRQRHLWQKSMFFMYCLFRQCVVMSSTSLSERVFIVIRGLLGMMCPVSEKLFDWFSNRAISRNKTL